MGHKRHKGTQNDTGDPRGHGKTQGTQGGTGYAGGHKENTGEHRVTQSKTA